MKILLIEDDKALAKMIAEALKHAKHLIDLAHNGEEGYALARDEYYDLIIIDYFLPDKRGDQILEDIRIDNNTTPIIIISASSDIDNKINALENGADDYIIKPFELSELLARIRAIWRRPPLIAPERHEIGELEIDFIEWTVKKNGKRLKMTNKEISLLKFFIDNKNVLLSRNSILEHVWDMNADPFSNTIETHIMKLRKSIGDKKHSLIQTIPGQGYILRWHE